MTDLPSFLRPFVAPYDEIAPETVDGIDYYLPDGPVPAPAMVFVHGGPVPPEVPVMPRGWSAYIGYGCLAAAAGAVGVVFDHSYRVPADVDRGHADVIAAVAAAREHPAVDPDRVVVLAFSGGGVFAGPFLAEAPPWLCGVSLTYPLLEHWDDQPSTYPAPADVPGVPVPILLTRAEKERLEAFDQTQTEYLASRPEVEAHVVAGGEHGFETINDTDAAREAITRTIDWSAQRLGLR